MRNKKEGKAKLHHKNKPYMGICRATEGATSVKLELAYVKDPPYTKKIICGKNY